MNALLHRTTAAGGRGVLISTLVATLTIGAAAPFLAAEATAGADPFARPNLAPAAVAEAVAVPAPAAPTATWRPALRAIVLAGDLSMVKIGGSVVELGEQIDGYRLILVTEEKAVFAKGRQRGVLTIGGDRGVAP